MPTGKWPPPGFPVVQGRYALTAEWSIDLPERFARRVEDESLVLWRPGLTLWIAAFDNDDGESRARRLAWLKEEASPARFDERETVENELTRWSYRLRDDSPDGEVESVQGFVIGEVGQLQVAVYFDDPSDEDEARQLVESVAARSRDQ